jgi:hypothetical protein
MNQRLKDSLLNPEDFPQVQMSVGRHTYATGLTVKAYPSFNATNTESHNQSKRISRFMRAGEYQTIPCFLRISAVRPQTSWQRPMPLMEDSLSASRLASKMAREKRGSFSMGSWSSPSETRWLVLAFSMRRRSSLSRTGLP